MGPGGLVLAAIAVAALGFLARIAVLLGREPGGVDAWYYLAYARAFHRKPGLRVRLPEYLLQNAEQSYAPVFPSLLGLLKERFLARHYWVVSPAIDCLTLLLLMLLTLRLTGEATAALLAGLVYAASPTMVSETRALSPRSFGVLAHAISVVLLIRALTGPSEGPWIAAALVAGAIVFLSSATAMASYLFVATALAIWLQDPRPLMLAAASMAAAFVFSLGHLGRVFANYVHAVRFWIRHRRRFGSHPILDSPIYGGPRASADARPRDPGFMGQGLAPQMLRLLGENPFLLALPLAVPEPGGWTMALFVWAASLSAFAVIATVVWPLRAFGPGRNYMKTAIFPTAFVLAVAASRAPLTPVGLLTGLGLIASAGSVAFFVVYMARKKDEVTAHVPPGLRAITARLAALPEGGVVCLPGGYSDYVTYRSERAVLWGSHSGSLDAFELVSPVWRERVEDAARRFGVRYLILESAYVDASVLALDAQCRLIERHEGFELFDLGAPGASVPAA